MKTIHNFTVEKKEGRKLCYKISGNNAPKDLEIRIYIRNDGRFKAESNYSKKPSANAGNAYQPRSAAFATEEQALENILSYFAASKEPYVKVE